MKNNIMMFLGIIMVSVIAVVLVITKKDYVVINFDSQGSTVVPSATIVKGERLNLPVVERKGYTFLGWYVSDTLVDNNTIFYEDVNLVAKWEELEDDTFMVSFNTNGGSRVDAIILKDGDLLTLPTPPTKEGYRFVGWFTALDVPIYDQVKLVKEDITLHAKWEKVD